MSAMNGDKSRYNRVRKQNIARRKRAHEMLKRMAVQRESLANPAQPKPGVTAA